MRLPWGIRYALLVVLGYSRLLWLRFYLRQTMALPLSACGLYGLISYFVTQRAQELTLRIALGASRQTIVALVLREGTALTLAGLVIGATAALAATRILARLLYGVSAADPIAFGSMILLVGAVAIAASWVPAYRAARADAVEVLRGG